MTSILMWCSSHHYQGKQFQLLVTNKFISTCTFLFQNLSSHSRLLGYEVEYHPINLTWQVVSAIGWGWVLVNRLNTGYMGGK